MVLLQYAGRVCTLSRSLGKSFPSLRPSRLEMNWLQDILFPMFYTNKHTRTLLVQTISTIFSLQKHIHHFYCKSISSVSKGTLVSNWLGHKSIINQFHIHSNSSWILLSASFFCSQDVWSVAVNQLCHSGQTASLQLTCSSCDADWYKTTFISNRIIGKWAAVSHTPAKSSGFDSCGRESFGKFLYFIPLLCGGVWVVAERRCCSNWA